jgi:hypothetical protein
VGTADSVAEGGRGGPLTRMPAGRYAAATAFRRGAASGPTGCIADRWLTAAEALVARHVSIKRQGEYSLAG